MQIELPELEKTLVALAVELICTPQEFSDFVIAPLEGQSDVALETMRMTLHYFTALLAYGFPVSYPPVKQVADWFTTPFPTEQRDRIDKIEMSRLEALLSMRPIHESVMPRLQQLMNQRSSDGRFDLGSEDNNPFDTLWALKVLNIARRAALPESVVPVENLRTWVDDYLETKPLDKDLALALNLRYELHGSLTEDQRKQHLQKLLDKWHESSGLWGVPNDMGWIPDDLRKQKLSVGDLRAQREPFRKMMLSTCYVVENLAPLVDLYPEITPTLRSSVELWWNVFYREPIQMFRELFLTPKKSYNYVIMLARTLIMFRSFFNVPLIEWGVTHTYDELIANRAKLPQSSLDLTMSHVLKQFINVEMTSTEELRYGLSGANVVRVEQPSIKSWNDDSKLKLADSLIVKFGAKDDIEAECANSNILPDAILNFYVNIPRDTYTDEYGISYLVIRDLHDYRTLDERLRNPAPGQIHKLLMRELPGFLLQTHHGGEREVVPASPGIIQDLYLLPMQTGISTIFRCLRDCAAVIDDKTRTSANDLYLRLNELCADLMHRQMQLGKFPKAYMHGDLHTRNIMLRQNERRNNLDHELDFKLIDLEKFSAEGDAAMDLGELLADLDLLLLELRNRSDRHQHPLANLSRTLSEAYRDFASSRHDDLFEVRVPLAKARFSIRVAKGKARLIDPGAISNKPSTTGDTVTEILRHCKTAVADLESVLSRIGSGTSTPPFVPLPEEEL